MQRTTVEPVGRPGSLRVAYGVIALAAIIAVGLIGGSVGQAVAEELRDRDRNSVTGRTSAQERSCEIDRRTLRTAEVAYRMEHQEFGGVYTTEAGLVTAGLLQKESDLHDIVLADPPTDFQVSPVFGAYCY